MKNSFKLKIITPEKNIFEAEASFIGLPGKNGRLGIEARHAPIVVALKAGILDVTLTDETRHEFELSEGTADFHANAATILVDTCREKK